MNNQKAKNFIGYAGCFVAFMSMGLMFFGVSSALVGVIISIIVSLIISSFCED